MNKVIITGANGFVGSALAKKLTAEGVEVVRVTRTEPLSENLTDVDVLFHFAREGGCFGKVFQNTSLQIKNITNDVAAVNMALKCGCYRFVYAQTYNFLEVREFLNGNITEPRYTNIYAASKTAAEIIGKTVAFNNDLEYVSGAPTMIFGPGNHHLESFSDIMLRKLLNGEDLQCVPGDNLYDMVYIDDVVNAFIAIAERGVNLKTYYIGSRKLRTFNEIVTEVRDIVAPAAKLNFGAYPESPQVINWANAGLDSLYNDTGWQCSADFNGNIVKTAEWIKTTM
jgi:nucleoside-diphosphate-sugar epimerase